MLFDPLPVTIRVAVDRHGPRTRIARLRGGNSLRTVVGSASDALSSIAKVRVAVARPRAGGKACEVLIGRRFVTRPCARSALRYTTATGARSWRFDLPTRARGFVVVFAYAVDEAGNRGPLASSGRTFG
jgi:hypothetical protein